MSAATIARSPAGRLSARVRLTVLLATLAAPVLGAPLVQGAGAQIITGVIAGSVRDPAGEALPGAVVTIGRRSASTNAEGEFRIAGLTPGPAVVTVRRLGYEMRTTPVNIDRGAGDAPPLEFVLHPLPAGLEEVRIEASRDLRDLAMTGFFDRQHAGIGKFITREQIEKRRATSFTELLRIMVPGMQLNGTGRTPNRSVSLRNSRCAPLIVLDGFPMTGGNFDLTSINPVTILGIEVYSGPSTVPAKFRNFREGESCGVIAIWFGVKKPNTMRQPTSAEFAYADSAAPVSAKNPVYGAHDVDVQARVDTANLVQPVFPDSLQAKGITGEVLAQFIVDASGFVLPGSIHMDSRSHPELSQSVMRALAISRFIPARKAGVPVRQVMVLPYRFVLENRGPER